MQKDCSSLISTIFHTFKNKNKKHTQKDTWTISSLNKIPVKKDMEIQTAVYLNGNGKLDFALGFPQGSVLWASVQAHIVHCPGLLDVTMIMCGPGHLTVSKMLPAMRFDSQVIHVAIFS